MKDFSKFQRFHDQFSIAIFRFCAIQGVMETQPVRSSDVLHHGLLLCVILLHHVLQLEWLPCAIESKDQVGERGSVDFTHRWHRHADPGHHHLHDGLLGCVGRLS